MKRIGARSIVALLLVVIAALVVRFVGLPEDEPAIEVDRETIARLQALGYAHEVLDDPGADGSPASGRAGVHGWQPERAWPGINLYTVGGLSKVELIDDAGLVLQRWQHPSTSEWYNATRLDSGDLLVIAAAGDLAPSKERRIRDKAEARMLLRYDAAGTLVWERRIPVHHDIQPVSPRSSTEGGAFLTLTSRFRRIEAVHGSAIVEDNGVATLSREGELVAELSLFDVLDAAATRGDTAFRWIEKEVDVRADGETVDLLHANSVVPCELPGREGEAGIFGPDRVLVSLRHQNAIVVIDLARRELVWSWGQDELSGPHDATVLADGHVLVFDNGLGREWSRVVEVDPRTDEIVWQYAADPRGDFYTPTRGSSQRLPNGNTLIAEADRGRAFEVTRAGEVVWTYWIPDRGRSGKRKSLTRIRRFAAPEPAGSGGDTASRREGDTLGGDRGRR